MSNGNALYFLTFIYDFSKYCWVYVLKTKDQVFIKFKEWKVLVEKKFDAKIRILDWTTVVNIVLINLNFFEICWVYPSKNSAQEF